MTCETVKVGEVTAIVCSSGRKRKRCACGALSTRLCDWKTGKSSTCSAPICLNCGSNPAWDKDLCAEHTKAWAAHPSNPENKKKGGS